MAKEWIRHPGEYIKEELVARNWNQRDLAFILGCPEQSLTLLLNGKKGVSLEMAKALADAFAVSAEFFVNLQRSFDLAHAPDPNPNIAKRAAIQSTYPMREMIKRCWLRASDAEKLEREFARHFEKENINDVPHISKNLAHAAKKSNYEELTAEQVAWLFRVRQIAKNVTAPAYSKAALHQAFKQLELLLLDPEEIRNVPRILMDCGVRFVIVEYLPSSKIDGACLWLDKNSPIIALSLRLDRIDNYWFVLSHEIKHVLEGHGMQHEIVDSDIMNTEAVKDEERIANEAAANFCVPTKDLRSFLVRKGQYISEQAVIGFARLMNRHPGIVVGQIQNKTKRYDFLRKHQIKIRKFAVQGAIVDGWGEVFPIKLIDEEMLR